VTRPQQGAARSDRSSKAGLMVGEGIDLTMRLIGAVTIVFILAVAFAVSGFVAPTQAEQTAATSERGRTSHDKQGQTIFRFDTFGDEQLWTDVLRMHEVLPTVDPTTALAVGLKVDVEALPAKVIAALQAGQVDLTDPAVTVQLLRLNAVVGVKGRVNKAGQLTRVGVTCALCHSSVDNSFAPGIGKRLDGWANTDLNVGAIVALSPVLDDATKAEFRSWGPGKYDPRHHAFDGTHIVPLNNPSLPVVIPAIYGLKGVGFETFTGDGPISYWNSYVGVSQMGGHGSFSDPRIGLSIRQKPDLVTPKLAALLDYQLSLRSPNPPRRSFNRKAAGRGRSLFQRQAGCSTCHQSPHFTDVLSGPDRRVPFLHDPAEVGMDPAYAARSATGRYRTTPLRGLLQHPPYFHDGSAPDLAAVVNHYDTLFGLNLTAAQKADLVEYLKSL
jgi:mono/diheme cytochrome c family protein